MPIERNPTRRAIDTLLLGVIAGLIVVAVLGGLACWMSRALKEF